MPHVWEWEVGQQFDDDALLVGSHDADTIKATEASDAEWDVKVLLLIGSWCQQPQLLQSTKLGTACR